MYRLIFTKEGVDVKKKVEKALTGGVDWITIESFQWRDLPKENIQIKVTGIDYELSSNNNGNISKLELTAEDIKRPESQPKKESEGAFWGDIEIELGIKKESGEIRLNQNRSAKDNLVEFVKYLFKHGYISESDIPIPSGYKRYLLNTVSEDKRGTEMISEEKIAENIWLETNWSTEKIKNIISELGEEFGKKRKERKP